MEHHCLDMILGGRRLSLEVGKVAQQANGSVLVRYGDTAVLVTACMSKEPREGIDFFPLIVDYEERLYAVGKIPGGWIKREGRPSEVATISARMIDRPLRPLFPEGFRHDVQVVCTVLSVEQDNDPDITALIGASAALAISDIPFEGPIGGVKVGRVNGEFVICPTLSQAVESDLNLTIAGSKNAILMVEAGADEVAEEVILDAISFGHEAVIEIVDLIERLVSLCGKPKREVPLYTPDEGVMSRVRELAGEDVSSALRIADKLTREERLEEIEAEILEKLMSDSTEVPASLETDVPSVLKAVTKEQLRKMVTEEEVRIDGRKCDEIRPIWCEVGLLPRVHGTGLFTRGQTQVLTNATLGAIGDEQLLDGLGDEESKRFMHHYNFPPYSVGEVRPIRGPGRREIGHGALAERALSPVIPDEVEFPYTIRLVSEVLESNGSTSQASVCGSTLALMDAGVPIKRPVAGIAMGLIKENEKVSILSDIMGIEDALGDMDFKVAGTIKGITALQMDIKVSGIAREIMEKALAQAKEGRMFILGKMLEVISEPRKGLSPYAPRIITMSIDPDKIRDVIGPGGKVIRHIIDETGVKIDIEDDGRVFIASQDEEAGEKAKKMIEDLTADVEVGRIYNGTVTRTTNFGAFVEILPGKEGLVHISQLAHTRVGKVEDVVEAGDPITVKVTEIDGMGRINLSRKDALPRDESLGGNSHGGQHRKRPNVQRYQRKQ
ncbi:MAG: polyribonucleotide nucleotidyltransferase [Firmicutes bacterium]|nr:polyribonucleotide nucleotidyltransferase [Bacillota bacterium]HXL03478.1 polyribonucleotide nucleotidyltransferase [Bacillota bacterium]